MLRRNPPAQGRRVNEEDVAGDDGRLFPGRNFLAGLRAANEALDPVDQALADALEGRRLLAARIESELLQQDARAIDSFESDCGSTGSPRTEMRFREVPIGRKKSPSQTIGRQILAGNFL